MGPELPTPKRGGTAKGFLEEYGLEASREEGGMNIQGYPVIYLRMKNEKYGSIKLV